MELHHYSYNFRKSELTGSGDFLNKNRAAGYNNQQRIPLK